MDQAVFYGILIPFLGTSLGAACVFFMKHDMSERLSRILTGFAAGVMVAAPIWSLLIPAMDQSEEMGKFAFIPAAAGFLGWLSVSASVITCVVGSVVSSAAAAGSPQQPSPRIPAQSHANIRCFIVIPPLLFSSPCKDSIKNTAPDKTSSAVSCFRLRLITSLHSGWYMVQYDVPDIPNEFHSSESEHCYKHPYLFRQESAYQ